MLLSLAPGMMSLMPDLEFTVTLAVTPLVNIVLLARDIFEGKPDPTLATAAVLSTVLYAFAAIGLAARIFGADAILYGSQATWSDLMRRPEEPRETATVPAAMFCLAVLFPIYFLAASTIHSFPDVDLARVVNSSTSSLPPISLTTRLIASAVITATVFLGVPLIAASIQRIRLASAFQLHASGPLSYLAAVILGLTLWPFAYEAFLLSNSSGLELASKLKEVQSWLNRLPDLSPAILLPCLAITPAVCEELFFRGYLFGAFRKTVRRWTAIIGSAVIFGVFHVIASTLSTERLIPSTLMGIVLGWVCYRTGSVFPGIVLHALHNGFLLMVAHYRENLVGLGWGIQEEAHLPTLWLCGAACGVLVAGGLLVAGTSRKEAAMIEVNQSRDDAPAVADS
jgi:ABC-2 type transport system permease protein/sodium transport system permease protein